MKKIFVIALALMAIVFSSCAVRLSDLSTDDYEKYVTSVPNGGHNKSPLSYNMIRGDNMFEIYNFRIAKIKNYGFSFYSGDKAKLMEQYFPDADVIAEQGQYFYIGKKRQ